MGTAREAAWALAVLGAPCVVASLSCGEAQRTTRGPNRLEGAVLVDGSSTVYPITEAMAEELQEDHPAVGVSVGISGTTGGFRRFCRGEADISDASREIKDAELRLCRVNGFDPVEIAVGFDGISVVVNPENDFVDCLTTDEPSRIWRPGSRVATWANVRRAWPAVPIALYGPGRDSGTFDYFTHAILGEEHASRPGFTASEDDNVLVQCVAGDRYALGYFGYSYHVENQDRLKLIGIDDGERVRQARLYDHPDAAIQPADTTSVHLHRRESPPPARGQGIHQFLSVLRHAGPSAGRVCALERGQLPDEDRGGRVALRSVSLRDRVATPERHHRLYVGRLREHVEATAGRQLEGRA